MIFNIREETENEIIKYVSEFCKENHLGLAEICLIMNTNTKNVLFSKSHDSFIKGGIAIALRDVIEDGEIKIYKIC